MCLVVKYHDLARAILSWLTGTTVLSCVNRAV